MLGRLSALINEPVPDERPRVTIARNDAVPGPMRPVARAIIRYESAGR
jgi:hypothetical protein